MNLDEAQIRSVVENVVRNLPTSSPAIVPSIGSVHGGEDGIFDTLDEAVAAAK